MRALLVRGMLVGLAAALLAYVVAWFAGEPQVAAAISIEETRAAATGEAAEPELVSRIVQETAGLLTALLVYGAALGGFFSIAYAFAHGRLGALGARATALVVASAGFVAVYVTPVLKYPPNPPAVGNSDTIGRRTALHFTMILIALLAAAVAAYAGRALSPRLGGWNATLAGIAVYAVLVGVSYAVLPRINEVPGDFPADTLWWFRVSSFGVQFVLWAAIGLLFGGLTERSLRQGARAGARAHPAATA
ncbi:CbtA family protein [Microbispora bryophytorum]|nr:CbtA family protein [Microbispora bryophytorum]TQS06916.1 CbtA family protein [Microbispora bryophytorum]